MTARTFSLLLLLAATSPARPDVLFLKIGNQVPCTITAWTDRAISVSLKDANASTTRDVPPAEIDYVEFQRPAADTAALTRAVEESRPDPLMETWVRQIPWLGRPRHMGGELGLTYADLLMRQPTADRLQRAMDVYSKIESADWDPARQTRARAGRLRVMLRQGRHAEVQPEARRLLTESDDPRVLIELNLVLAENAATQLAALVRDHPRWEQEDDIRPEHHHLLQESLDGYLFAHVFHGAETDLAARGLWAACQLFETANSLDDARSAAEDLTKLYAGTPEATTAATWLEKHPAAPKKAPPAAAHAVDEEAESPPSPPAKKPRKPRTRKTPEKPSAP